MLADEREAAPIFKIETHAGVTADTFAGDADAETVQSVEGDPRICCADGGDVVGEGERAATAKDLGLKISWAAAEGDHALVEFADGPLAMAAIGAGGGQEVMIHAAEAAEAVEKANRNTGTQDGGNAYLFLGYKDIARPDCFFADRGRNGRRGESRSVLGAGWNGVAHSGGSPLVRT